MPSLFSRSRTTSTPTNTAGAVGAGYDEFGRVSSPSRGSNTVTAAKGTRDNKKKSSDKERFRLRTLSSTTQRNSVELDDPLANIPDGSFLALDLEPPRLEVGEERPKEHDYGYLSYQRHVVLGLEQVARLVEVVAAELGTRGLTTPFIFSTLALDISFNSIKSLIRAFLRTCANPKSADAERQWRDEARFAGPNELGMTLRWGLARLVRIHGGQEVRGLVAYEYYAHWRNAEAALNYPPAHFHAFLSELTPILGSLITNLLTLLSRFTAHSSSSGHTPPTLSPLFGPLFFGLGPAALPFHYTYIHYLRAVNSMEHLMLAFIRWQDSHTTQAHGSAASMGIPARLKDWIRGYPSMLPDIQNPRSRDEMPQPRRGARTMRVVSVRRNVRMYSPDLVKTGASWATRPRGLPGQGENGLVCSKEWQRIAPPTLKLPPRYSDGYKKRMDMPPNFHPQIGPGASSMSSTPSTSSTISSSTGSTLVDDEIGESLLEVKKGEVRSLTALKWGEFETMGFSNSVAAEKKLEFDLTEGARAERAARRATLTWQDFSTAGFSRNDVPLSATLQFSVPVTHTISSWPAHSAEIHRKLKKAQKALPPFGWDTEPVMSQEEVIEEAFLDVFCDLIYGGGWMDNERLEEHDRECNWALVEFKSLPISRTNTVSGTNDPRTSSTLILFEEFVPWEYRKQLGSSGRRRLPSLFSASSKSKQWKPAATLNGRPYVVGHVPKSPTVREVEFEGLLRGNASLTKIVTLDGTVRNTAPPNGSPRSNSANGHNDMLQPNFTPARSATEPVPRPNNQKDLPPITPTKKGSRFRLAGGLPVGGPASTKTAGLTPAEAKPVDFETRLAAISDDDLNNFSSGNRTKQERRRSKDDAWVDILVASSSRKIADQTAELRPPRPLRAGRSDPELASQEVALALASVRGKVFPDDDDEGMEPVPMSAEPEADERHFAEEETEESVQYEPPKRRLGYFDLHPERRPTSVTMSDDDPRGRYSRGADSDEEDAYGGIDFGHPAHISPPSNYSHGSDDYEPSLSAVPDDEIGDYADDTASDVPPIVETMLVSSTADASKSKTASLIEMYRERERAASAGLNRVEAAPSPVRGAIAKLNKEQTPLPPAPDNSAIDDPAVLDLPRITVEETGRQTPPRYIHGAPLHNVLEEEEEE
ncbi:hypothetical protein NEOLEDRAFT_1182461 [Neolentinus lepideus HHB14362 ss-1]|uniref:Meiotically up-regulated protein Msb1/Mug8 domain-containing protein n=1 Tax=Neolentinus lepideus HHB14362 ss-1 TaxID=1314782 RepID=A0A165P485_9AGAM|nr:hypothetical protein NEOLEDRAFT_1182461 [Neolentinus lepideus HHB14362 ss-1]